MEVTSGENSFYHRFVKKLSCFWKVMGPVVATDGVCRLRETDEPAAISCLPRLPLKKLLLPQSEVLWMHMGGRYRSPSISLTDIALIDIAPCDLYALAYLDHTYAADPHYLDRRQHLLLIGRECSPSPTCHCPPRDAPPPCDLFFGGGSLWCMSAIGGRILQDLVAGEEGVKIKDGTIPQEYWGGQTASLPDNLSDLFLQSLDNPLWAEAAAGCLSCGACSALCPTCACYDLVDDVAVDGGVARQRIWDNCFFRDHGLVAGGYNFRPNRAVRLRFRFEHKYLGFGGEKGISACVGCGRCQQVCPAGISLAQILQKLSAGGEG